MRGLSWSVVLFGLLLPTIVTWAYFVALANQPAWMQQTAYVVGKAIQFALPIVCAVWLLPRALAIKPPTSKGVWLGLAFGLLFAALMVALYHGWFKHMAIFTGPDEQIRKKISGMAIDSAWKFAALGLFYAVCHSFLEEYYWRWFIFHELRKITPTNAAIAISSLGFMAHHIIVLWIYFGMTWPTLLFSLAIAIGGAFWAWLYHTTDSLIGPWLGHLLIDAAIFIIGYDIARDVFVR